MIGRYGNSANASALHQRRAGTVGNQNALERLRLAANHRSAGMNPAVAFVVWAIRRLAASHRPAGINPAVAFTG
jgi:hypothetical protein